MGSELTDKTMVVVSRLGDFWVNPERAKSIMANKKDDPSGGAYFDNNLIAHSAIDGVITAEQYEILNRRRRGGWQCKYRWWHERGQQCAHDRYNPKG